MQQIIQVSIYSLQSVLPSVRVITVYICSKYLSFLTQNTVAILTKKKFTIFFLSKKRKKITNNWKTKRKNLLQLVQFIAWNLKKNIQQCYCHVSIAKCDLFAIHCIFIYSTVCKVYLSRGYRQTFFSFWDAPYSLPNHLFLRVVRTIRFVKQSTPNWCCVSRQHKNCYRRAIRHFITYLIAKNCMFLSEICSIFNCLSI